VPMVPEEILELGLRWRLRRAKGLDYSAELVEYNSSVKSEYAARKGLGDILIGGISVPDVTSGTIPENGFG
jgi:hypothetical protein